MNNSRFVQLPKGICLCRNNKDFGSIFVNINKNGDKYIRQLLPDGKVKNLSIPKDYINSDLQLEDVVKLLNIVDAPPAPAGDKVNDKKAMGKLIGTWNNDNIWLNKGNFGYYLRVGTGKVLYTVKHFVDIDKLDIESCINIIKDAQNSKLVHDYHNNSMKLINCDSHYNNNPIKLIAGNYGPYFRYDKYNITIPKQFRDTTNNFTQDQIKNIIDSYISEKNSIIKSHNTLNVPVPNAVNDNPVIDPSNKPATDTLNNKPVNALNNKRSEQSSKALSFPVDAYTSSCGCPDTPANKSYINAVKTKNNSVFKYNKIYILRFKG